MDSMTMICCCCCCWFFVFVLFLFLFFVLFCFFVVVFGFGLFVFLVSVAFVDRLLGYVWQVERVAGEGDQILVQKVETNLEIFQRNTVKTSTWHVSFSLLKLLSLSLAVKQWLTCTGISVVVF